MFRRQFTDVMAFARATDNDEPGENCEAESAKERAHTRRRVSADSRAAQGGNKRSAPKVSL
jgi:hypothetical protein